MPKLPFEPEPLTSMLQRLPAALEPVFEPLKIIAGDAPGLDRANTFDFEGEPRLRLLITRERMGQKVMVHLSANLGDVAVVSAAAKSLGFPLRIGDRAHLKTENYHWYWDDHSGEPLFKPREAADAAHL